MGVELSWTRLEATGVRGQSRQRAPQRQRSCSQLQPPATGGAAVEPPPPPWSPRPTGDRTGSGGASASVGSVRSRGWYKAPQTIRAGSRASPAGAGLRVERNRASRAESRPAAASAWRVTSPKGRVPPGAPPPSAKRQFQFRPLLDLCLYQCL